MQGKQQTAVRASGAGREDGLKVQWVGDIGLNGPFCDPQHHVPLAESMAEVARGLGYAELTDRPGRIADIVTVGMAHPRDLGSPEYGRVKNRLYELLGVEHAI